MARINIEDSLWADPRFQELLIKAGNRHTAKGMILELWTVAQKYWIPSRGQGIPKPAWKDQGIPDVLIEVGFARDNGEFVYAIGSKEQFAWLNANSENGKKGGPAAAKSRREKTGKSKRPKSSKNDETRPPSLLPSPSPSPSPDSSSSSNSILYSVGEGASAPPPPREIRSPIGFFIANYVNAYQQRYGGKARPSLAGKVQGQIRRFLDETPLERACQLIQVYCQMNDAWFLTKCHDFGTFIENLSKVGVALDTGRTVTGVQARQEERYQTNLDVVRTYAQETGGIS